MTTAEILREARALIDTPEKWTQDNTYGSDLCFCADGAIHAAVHGISNDGRPRLSDGDASRRRARQVAQDVLVEAVQASGICGLHEYNDDASTTHADVMAAFDRAIALAGRLAA